MATYDINSDNINQSDNTSGINGFVKVKSNWKEIKKGYCKVSDTWKEIKTVYKKTDDWR